MANKKPKPRSGKHDVAPIVRGAFLEALEHIKRTQNKTFSQIIAEWMINDPGAVLNAVAKFTVREAKVDGDLRHIHEHNLSDTERASRIAAIFDGARARGDRQSLEARPVDASTGSADPGAKH